jgi:hypothetical protein
MFQNWFRFSKRVRHPYRSLQLDGKYSRLSVPKHIPRLSQFPYHPKRKLGVDGFPIPFTQSPGLTSVWRAFTKPSQSRRSSNWVQISLIDYCLGSSTSWQRRSLMRGPSCASCSVRVQFLLVKQSSFKDQRRRTSKLYRYREMRAVRETDEDRGAMPRARRVC